MPLVTRVCERCSASFECEHWRKKRFCTKYCGDHASKNKRHGLSYSLEHRSWRNMIDRCTNPLCKYWPNYGGRGITVCERWFVFENFYADMGPKPTDRSRYSIERIDNSKGYQPGNCKWATPHEQNNNRRGCWTPEEDQKIRDTVARGLNFRQAAEALGKPMGSLTARAYRIGIKSGQPCPPRAAVTFPSTTRGGK